MNEAYILSAEMFILENLRDCSIIKYKNYIQLYPEITTINIFCVSLMYSVYRFVIKVLCMLLQVLNNFSIVILHVIFLFSHSTVVGHFLLPVFLLLWNKRLENIFLQA